MSMSGTATPVAFPVNFGAPSQACTIMPALFFRNHHMKIPCGIVQQSRAVFERNISIPSFFAQQ